MAGIITLTTDFGLSDAYVGVLKGVIIGLAPQATIVDICHSVEPQDVIAANYILAGAYTFFSDGTVHLAVVDPGVGTSRRPIAIHAGGHYFVGPDNGLFTFVLTGPLADSAHAVQLTEQVYWLSGVSATFHGRDIFAPVAAHLSNGVALSALGPALSVGELARVGMPQPAQQGRVVLGAVVHVDHFGNLVTNVRAESLPDGNAADVEIAGHRIAGLSHTYGDRPAGELLALIGSTGYLEVAVAAGSAAQRLAAGKGTPVRAGRIRRAQLSL